MSHVKINGVPLFPQSVFHEFATNQYGVSFSVPQPISLMA